MTQRWPRTVCVHLSPGVGGGWALGAHFLPDFFARSEASSTNWNLFFTCGKQCNPSNGIDIIIKILKPKIKKITIINRGIINE